MTNNNQKKNFSWFSFHKESKFGVVEGTVFNMKEDTYMKNGVPSKKLTFSLACSNIHNKVKYILDAEPAINEKNPETTFINCAVFGTNVERFQQFMHDKDRVEVTGILSCYAGNKGNRLNLLVSEARVRYYASNKNQALDEPATFSEENQYSEMIDDEIPF